MPLRSVIVEDEPLSRQYITALLKNMDEIDICGIATTQDEAVQMITELQPQLIFMDLELHTGTGFEVLKKINSPSLTVVFTTALDHLALKIIKLSGMLYLQKPLDADELEAAVKKIHGNKNSGGFQKALHHLLETLHNNNLPVHISVPGSADEYVALQNIIKIESADRGTVLYLKDTEAKNSDLSLKDYELLLTDFNFFRVNVSVIINLYEAQGKIFSGNNIKMNDGSIQEISPKKRDELLIKLAALKSP